jgi:hypothetical protein
MKLCKDCKYCKPFIWNGDVLFHHCTLRSHKYIIDPVDGIYAYKEYSTVRCVDERQDSTGFFGLFIDKDRCGVDAKNFEPKESK